MAEEMNKPSSRTRTVTTNHFIEQQLPPLLLMQVHHLDGDTSARARVGSSTNDSRAALADPREAGQGSPGVAFADDESECRSELLVRQSEFVFGRVERERAGGCDGGGVTRREGPEGALRFACW